MALSGSSILRALAQTETVGSEVARIEPFRSVTSARLVMVASLGESVALTRSGGSLNKASDVSLPEITRKTSPNIMQTKASRERAKSKDLSPAVAKR
jgi:hypothetical protein